MNERSIYQIAILGAQCSGKTEVVKALERLSVSLNIQRSADMPEIMIAHEPWELFEPFALAIIQLYQNFTNEILEELKKSLVSRLVIQEFTELGLQMLGGLNEFAQNGLENKTLQDVYEFFDMQFLDDIRDGKTLKIVLVRELIRLQLIYTRMLIDQTPGTHPLAIISDGSELYNLSYFPRVSHWQVADALLALYPDYLKELRKYEDDDPGIVARHSPGFGWILTKYRFVFFLETLANLPLDEIEQYYYDGRRLDPPAQAQEVHTRIKRWEWQFEDYPGRYMLPAAMTLEQKIRTIEEIILKGLFGDEYSSILSENQNRII